MGAVKVEVEIVNEEEKLEGFTPGELLGEVNECMNKVVSRSALFRWRKSLNILDPPFTPLDVKALALYGNLISLGAKPNKAKKRVLDYIDDLEHLTKNQGDENAT
jgi:hypothetical protein